MSLLDDVSIVVTPNGYKAGKLYAVVPVPTEGAEKIDNGSNTIAGANWNANSNWDKTVAGLFSCDGSTNDDINQGANLPTVNLQYIISFEILSINSGGVFVANYGGVVGTNRTSVGVYSEIITAVNSTERIRIRPNASGTIGGVTAISVKEYTAADMDVTRETAATRVDEAGLVNYAEIVGSEDFDFTTGSTLNPASWGSATTNGVNYLGIGSGASYYNTGFTVTTGITYRLSLTLSNYNGSGDLGWSSTGGVPTTGRFSGDETITLDFKATANAELRIFGRSTNTGEFSNASLKEVTRDNVPRIDYSGGGCPHILAEPLRTNLIPYSEDFSQWFKIGSPTLTSNYGVSPDGTQNSTRLQMSTTNKIFATVSASGNISFTVYLKGTGQIRLRDNTSTGLQDVTLTNEWVRYELNFNATISNFQIEQQSGTSDLEIFGTQLEEGSYATSYIPTNGGTVTRNQDIFTRDGIGSLIGSEGVLFVEMAALSNDLTNRVISLNDGTGSNRLMLYFNSGNNTIAVAGVGGTISYVVTDETAFNKMAVRYKTNDITLWVDGDSRGTPIELAAIPTFTALKFDSGGGNSKFYGKVKQLQIYDTYLSNGDMQTLTE